MAQLGSRRGMERAAGLATAETKAMGTDFVQSFTPRENRTWADRRYWANVAWLGALMAGVTTDVCLVFPAIDAVGEGYAVQAVMDASGSPLELSEDMSRRRMQDAGVVLTATNTVIAELAQNWSTPEGQQLIQLLFTEVLPPIAA